MCYRPGRHSPAPLIATNRSTVTLLQQSHKAALQRKAHNGIGIQPAWPHCLKPTSPRPLYGPKFPIVYAKGRNKEETEIRKEKSDGLVLPAVAILVFVKIDQQMIASATWLVRYPWRMREERYSGIEREGKERGERERKKRERVVSTVAPVNPSSA